MCNLSCQCNVSYISKLVFPRQSPRCPTPYIKVSTFPTIIGEATLSNTECLLASDFLCMFGLFAHFWAFQPVNLSANAQLPDCFTYTFYAFQCLIRLVFTYCSLFENQNSWTLVFIFQCIHFLQGAYQQKGILHASVVPSGGQGWAELGGFTP